MERVLATFSQHADPFASVLQAQKVPETQGEARCVDAGFGVLGCPVISLISRLGRPRSSWHVLSTQTRRNLRSTKSRSTSAPRFRSTPPSSKKRRPPTRRRAMPHRSQAAAPLRAQSAPRYADYACLTLVPAESNGLGSRARSVDDAAREEGRYRSRGVPGSGAGAAGASCTAARSSARWVDVALTDRDPSLPD